MKTKELHNRAHLEIFQDHEALTPAVQKHIEQCSVCLAELQFAQAIKSAVIHLPMRPVPSNLAVQIRERLLSPAYRLWHIAAALLFLVFSPIVFSYSLRWISGGVVQGTSIVMFSLFGVLVFLMIAIGVTQMMHGYRVRMEHFKDSCDAYIEHGVQSALKYLHK
ncbi:MAG: hypothetical protein KDK27_09360 [Leptospiraceae bacterium]|nr:hypothetical protein [Leptospiraceae bacterium]